MGGNAQQPRAETGFLTKAGKVLHGAEKGLLGHVLGILLVPQHSQSKGIHPLLVAIGQRLESIQLTRFGTAYQLGIGRFRSYLICHANLTT